MTPCSRLFPGLLVFLAAAPAFAVTDTWDGGGADDIITTALNWVDNTAPASDIANTDLIFGGIAGWRRLSRPHSAPTRSPSTIPRGPSLSADRR